MADRMGKARDNQRPDDVAALHARINKLTGLLDIAKAMTAERDLDALLRLIVDQTARVANADRCSLWILDRTKGELWTRIAHGLGRGETIRCPVGVGIVGQVAESDQIINIPDAYQDARFNREIDKRTGYRTRHILGVPMRSTTGEVTGVLQSLNKLEGDCFTGEDEELLMAFGANAAAAIENAILYEEIDGLFEGFVRASVTAIESRDPTTSGHSERVATLTLGLADSVAKVATGPYRALALSQEEKRELRYAALLHDFGKVGVRENVLTKGKKLFSEELQLIEARFRRLFSERENQLLRSALASVIAGKGLPDGYEKLLARDAAEVDEFLAFIRHCNEPTVLDSHGFGRLQLIATQTFYDAHGHPEPLLLPQEVERLSIPRGSLDPTERLEIESHVTHTYRFLSQIPWTRSLRNVPDLAYGHHEKLDGSGYPRKLGASALPPQTRMMTISDIYDALTASDRPYKTAVPHERALDILTDEVHRGQLDADLFVVFVDARVHECLAPTARR